MWDFQIPTAIVPLYPSLLIYIFFLARYVLQLLCEELNTEKFVPVSWPKSSPLIAAYDEHVLVNHFKFGLLHQRFGQTTEEDIFANNGTSPALDEFLDVLGKRIHLLDHKG